MNNRNGEGNGQLRIIAGKVVVGAAAAFGGFIYLAPSGGNTAAAEGQAGGLGR